MGVIYFGDIDEDSVTNGAETLRFSELIRDRAGYRYLETLGTRPSVYYLPPVERQFPVDKGFNGLDKNVKNRYENTPYSKTHKL
jgi:molybdopterin-containing oxidoreductase family iron-sulfur binding subunit